VVDPDCHGPRLVQVAALLVCHASILLEGPAAVGKTALIGALANGRRVERVNNTADTSIETYLGSFVPVGGGRFEFQKGALFRAMESGSIFLADEFNLCDPSVLSLLAPLLEGAGGGELRVPGTGIAVRAHPDFVFIATQNDARTYAGRNRLPLTLRDRFVEVQVEDFGPELVDILEQRRGALQGGQPMPRFAAEALASVYHTLATGPVGSRITMRELVKWAGRRAQLGPVNDPARDARLWHAAGASLLLPRAPTAEVAALTIKALKAAFEVVAGRLPVPSERGVAIEPRSPNEVNVRLYGDVVLTIPGALERVSAWAAGVPPASLVRHLAQAMVASSNGEPVMLVGPRCYKSLIIDTLIDLMGRRAETETCFLSPENEALDLIGQMQPFTPPAALREIMATASRALHRAASLQGCEGIRRLEAYRQAESLLVDMHTAAEAYRLAAQEAAAAQAAASEEGEGEAGGQIPAGWSSDSEGKGSDDEDEESSAVRRQGSQSHMDLRLRELADVQAAFQAQAHPSDEFEMSASDDGFEDLADDESSDASGELIHLVLRAKGPASEETQPSAFDDDESSSDTTSVAPTPPPAPQRSAFDDEDSDGGSCTGRVDATTKVVSQRSAFDDDRSEDEDERRALGASDSGSAADRNVRGAFSDSESSSVAEDTSSWSDMAEAEASAEPSVPVRRRQPSPWTVLNELRRSERREGKALAAAGKLRDCLQIVQKIRSCLQDVAKAHPDPGAQQLDGRIERLQRFLEQVAERGGTDTAFAFREGPVTRAVLTGGVLVLEDYDAPSPAVTERLNSLTEPELSFALTEDISRKEGQDIPVPKSMRIFATAHRARPDAKLKLSAATLSRFTVIYVDQYEDDEMAQVLKSVLRSSLPDQATTLVEHLMRLLQRSRTEGWPGSRALSLAELLRACDYLVAEAGRARVEGGLPWALMVAARFLLLDNMAAGVALNVAQEWSADCNLGLEGAQLSALFLDPDDAVCRTALELLEDHPAVRCAYSGVTAPLAIAPEDMEVKDLATRFGLQLTPTTVKNLARIMVSGTAGAHLLMQGPPGIGKTAIVLAVARLLGHRVERINLSANTTLDQLLGSIVPCMVGGQRTFTWQDGKLLTALKAGKWLLFDELNLAPPEVLEALLPLLRRGAEVFAVPGTDIQQPLRSLRVFATMNPTSVGGGRSKLSRSLQGLFTTVVLDAYEPRELFEIVKGVFAPLLDPASSEGWNVMTESLLVRTFQLHEALGKLAQQREIGRVGGPFELNLRDLAKLRDVLRGNAANLRDQCRFLSGSGEGGRQGDGEGEGPGDDSDVRTLALQTFFDLVYAQRFQCVEDRARVQALIQSKDYLGVSETLRATIDRVVDASVPGLLRIGAAYLDSGCHEDDLGDGLVHTPAVVARLEALAAAVAAARPVLLEGETCSGKSALVEELARLAKRKLVVLSMTHETETSDLIGQWLPVDAAKRAAAGAREVRDLLQEVLRTMMGFVLPVCSSWDEEKTSLSSVPALIEEAATRILQCVAPSEHTEEHEEETLETSKAALEAAMRALDAAGGEEHLPSFLRRECRALYHRALPHSRALARWDDEGQERGNSTTFAFVESRLVRAMREGDWVLMDRVDAAPPEVMERLNPLLEDEPTLNLLELGTGEELSRDSGIHPNFRIFLSAAGSRGNRSANKLSAAFRNRVLPLWLPVLDDSLADVAAGEQGMQTHDAFVIALAQLPEIPGSAKLAELLLRLHASGQRRLEAKEITTVGGACLTFRTLLRTLRCARRLMEERGASPVAAMVQAVRSNYIICCAEESSQRALLNDFVGLLEDPKVLTAAVTRESPALLLGRAADAGRADCAALASSMRALEGAVLRALATLLLQQPPLRVAHVAHLAVEAGVCGAVNVTELDVAIAHLSSRDVLPARVKVLQVLRLDPQDLLARLPTSRNEVQAGLKRVQEGLIARLGEAGDAATAHIAAVASGASLLDAEHRVRMLGRVMRVRSTLTSVLGQVLADDQSDDSVASSLLAAAQSAVATLGAAQEAQKRLAVVASSRLHTQLRQAEHALASRRSLFYLLKRDLALPLSRSHASLTRVLATLVEETRQPEVLPLASSLLWACASFEAVRRLPTGFLRLLSPRTFAAVPLERLLQAEQAYVLATLQRTVSHALQHGIASVEEAQVALAAACSKAADVETTLTDARRRLASSRRELTERLNEISRMMDDICRKTQTSHDLMSLLGDESPLAEAPPDVQSSLGRLRASYRLSVMEEQEMRVREAQDCAAEASHASAVEEQQRQEARLTQAVQRLAADVQRAFDGEPAWAMVKALQGMRAARKVAALLHTLSSLPPDSAAAVHKSQGDLRAMPKGPLLRALRGLGEATQESELLRLFALVAFVLSGEQPLLRALLIIPGVTCEEEVTARFRGEPGLWLLFLYGHDPDNRLSCLRVVSGPGPTYVEHIRMRDAPPLRTYVAKLVERLRGSEETEDALVRDVELVPQGPGTAGVIDSMGTYLCGQDLPDDPLSTDDWGAAFASHGGHVSQRLDELQEGLRQQLQGRGRCPLVKDPDDVSRFVEAHSVAGRGRALGPRDVRGSTHVFECLGAFGRFLEQKRAIGGGELLDEHVRSLVPPDAAARAQLLNQLEALPDRSILGNVLRVMEPCLADAETRQHVECARAATAAVGAYQRVASLLPEYVAVRVEAGADDAQQVYGTTPRLLATLQSRVYEPVRSALVDAPGSVGSVTLSRSSGPHLFQQAQDDLMAVLDGLDMPLHLRQRWKLDVVFAQVAGITPEARDGGSVGTEAQGAAHAGDGAREAPPAAGLRVRGRVEQMLMDCVLLLERLLKEAHGIEVPPRSLIQAMSQHLYELWRLQDNPEELGLHEVQRRSQEVHLWGQKLKSYREGLQTDDPVLSRLGPEVKGVTEVMAQARMLLEKLWGAARSSVQYAGEDHGSGETRDLVESLRSFQHVQGVGAAGAGDMSMRTILDTAVQADYVRKLVPAVFDGRLPRPDDVQAWRRLRAVMSILCLDELYPELHRVAVQVAEEGMEGGAEEWGLGTRAAPLDAVRREIVSRLANRRRAQLQDPDFQALLGNMERLRCMFCVADSDSGEPLHRRLVSQSSMLTAFPLQSALEQQRQKLSNIIGSYEGTTTIQPRPPGLVLSDLLVLLVPEATSAVELALQMQCGFDEALSARMELPTPRSTLELLQQLPRVPTLEYWLPADLAIVDPFSPLIKATLHQGLGAAIDDVLSDVDRGIQGVFAADGGRAEAATAEHCDTVLSPLGLVESLEHWPPVQAYLAGMMLHLAQATARVTLSRGCAIENLLNQALSGTERYFTEAQRIKRSIEGLEGDLARVNGELEVQRRRCRLSSLDIVAQINERKLQYKLDRLTDDLCSERERYDIELRIAQERMRQAAAALLGELEALLHQAFTAGGAMACCLLGDAEGYQGLALNALAGALLRALSRGQVPAVDEAILLQLRDMATQAEQSLHKASELLAGSLRPGNIATEQIRALVQRLATSASVSVRVLLNLSQPTAVFMAQTSAVAPVLWAFHAAITPRLAPLSRALGEMFQSAKQERCDARALLAQAQEAYQCVHQLDDAFRGFGRRLELGTPNRDRGSQASLEELVSSARHFALRGMHVALSLAKRRHVVGCTLDGVLGTLGEDLRAAGDTQALSLADFQLEPELKLLGLQRQGLAALSRGVLLRVALGVAAWPFELLSSLSQALTDLDDAMLGPSYLAHHFHTDVVLQLLPPAETALERLPDQGELLKVAEAVRTAYECLARVKVTTDMDPAAVADPLAVCWERFGKVDAAVAALEDSLLRAAKAFVAHVRDRVGPHLVDSEALTREVLGSLRDVVSTLSRQLLDSCARGGRDALVQAVQRGALLFENPAQLVITTPDGCRYVALPCWMCDSATAEQSAEGFEWSMYAGSIRSTCGCSMSSTRRRSRARSRC
jgi:MoxR-like ATPase